MKIYWKETAHKMGPLYGSSRFPYLFVEHRCAKRDEEYLNSRDTILSLR